MECDLKIIRHNLFLQIGAKCGVGAENVKNVIIWGNHSATQYPDVSHATVAVSGGVQKAYDAVKDDSWLKGDFITVSQIYSFR